MALRIAQIAGLALIVILALPFAWHAVTLGLSGLTEDLTGQSRFFARTAPAATGLVFAHMVAGGLITVLAPLQLIPAIRRRAPALHRVSGRLIVLASLLAAIGGLGFIVLRGTIGGPWMNTAFALYGVLMLLAATETFRHARARRLAEHRRWALRLFVLAIGSWIYRLHYGLWYATTDGLWSNEAFTGGFDRVTLFAFYLPYLLLLELYLRRAPAR